jgi:hypothetical protein
MMPDSFSALREADLEGGIPVSGEFRQIFLQAVAKSVDFFLVYSLLG